MKIIVRMPNWLGDVIMATAFLNALHEKYPEATIDVIVKKGFEAFPLPIHGERLVFDKALESAASFGRSLRRRGYDEFYVLPPSFSSAWMAYLSQAKRRIGYINDLRFLFLNDGRLYRVLPRRQHIVKEYLDLLAPFESVREFVPQINVSPEWVSENCPKDFEVGAPYVVLSPGTAYGPARKWPLDFYAQVANEVHAQGFRVVVIGASHDQYEAETLSRSCSFLENLCGKTSVNGLIAVLSKADLLVTNDTGPMHLMSAIGRPLVSIWGSTSPTWTGPLSPNAKVIYDRVDCSPCFAKTCKFNDYHCLTRITPQTVMSCIHEILEK